MFTISFAALSMSLVIVSFELLKRVRRDLKILSVSVVFVSPSWYKSIRGFGTGRMKGGRFLVVGVFDWLCGGGWGGSPTWGMVAIRAM